MKTRSTACFKTIGLRKIYFFLIVLNVFIQFGSMAFAQAQTGNLNAKRAEAIEIYNASRQPLLNGDYSKAEEMLKKAYEICDSDPLIQNNYGLVLFKLGKANDAVEILLKATSADSPPAPAWLNLGYAYELQGQFSKAIGAFEKYIAIAPNSSFLNSSQSTLLY